MLVVTVTNPGRVTHYHGSIASVISGADSGVLNRLVGNGPPLRSIDFAR